MNIKTITCHDVYNLGASLQAYALAAYLKDAGHDVQIIDYKPDYLSRHYSLSWVSNPQFDKPLLRQAYLLAKLPGRLEALTSPRKRRFDDFRRAYLPLTGRYGSFAQLKENCPEADLYIAGSDQIWNPLFQNGKDPAFFLQFAPPEKKRISYAASLAVETLMPEDAARMKPWLEELDAISVREASAVRLLAELGLESIQVADPVFLLPREHWAQMAVDPGENGYILVYDFDRSPAIEALAKNLASETGQKIVSVFPMAGADAVWQDMGPLEFLGALQNAGTVLSNSFHATAFSLIFHKDFYVLNRQEGINTRMKDLLEAVGLAERLIDCPGETGAKPVDWAEADRRLQHIIADSKAYLKAQITI